MKKLLAGYAITTVIVMITAILVSVLAKVTETKIVTFAAAAAAAAVTFAAAAAVTFAAPNDLTKVIATTIAFFLTNAAILYFVSLLI
ncbi:MAG: hypothetical protein PHQ42_04505 [Patescibacteria group bacterium]|nr:hypothetical protein [Patescibacteria group bacterium]